MTQRGANGRVELTIEAGVADLRLADPEHKNCFSIELGEDLVELYQEIEDADDVVTVCLTADGDVFCAGLDLDIVMNAGERAEEMDRMGSLFWPATEWLANCPYPTVVGAQGAAPGAGAGMANAADILVVDEGFQIWWPEINVGITPYGLGPGLARQVGHRRATELTLLGREAKLPAEEAKALGLVNRVVPEAEVDDEARDIAATLAEHEREYGTVLDVYEVIQEHKRRSSGSEVLADWKGRRDDWF